MYKKRTYKKKLIRMIILWTKKFNKLIKITSLQTKEVLSLLTETDVTMGSVRGGDRPLEIPASGSPSSR